MIKNSNIKAESKQCPYCKKHFHPKGLESHVRNSHKIVYVRESENPVHEQEEPDDCTLENNDQEVFVVQKNQSLESKNDPNL